MKRKYLILIVLLLVFMGGCFSEKEEKEVITIIIHPISIFKSSIHNDSYEDISYYGAEELEDYSGKRDMHIFNVYKNESIRIEWKWKSDYDDENEKWTDCIGDITPNRDGQIFIVEGRNKVLNQDDSTEKIQEFCVGLYADIERVRYIDTGVEYHSYGNEEKKRYHVLHFNTIVGDNGEWSWLQGPYSRIEWEYKNDDGVWELKGKSVEVFKDGQVFILGKDITYDFIGGGKYHDYPGYMPD